MTIEHATCARLPIPALATLARFRQSEGISVILDGDHAWAFWEAGDDRVFRAVLPVEGVELFERRSHSWHRAGRRLPSPDGPPEAEPIPLARAVTPAPFAATPPSDDPTPTLPLELARDAHPRPTTAALCSLDAFGTWAETATSGQIGALRGAVRGETALILGPKLPSWPEAVRYWGVQLLVPLGYVMRPSLPEATILQALGTPGRELLRVIPVGAGDEEGRPFEVEAIPLDAFRPLNRAGVRLARVGASRT